MELFARAAATQLMNRKWARYCHDLIIHFSYVCHSMWTPSDNAKKLVSTSSSHANYPALADLSRVGAPLDSAWLTMFTCCCWLCCCCCWWWRCRQRKKQRMSSPMRDWPRKDTSREFSANSDTCVPSSDIQFGHSVRTLRHALPTLWNVDENVRMILSEYSHVRQCRCWWESVR